MAKAPQTAPETVSENPEIEREMEDFGIYSAAAKRIGLLAATSPMASGTLAGDVRDMLIDIIKTRPKPWSAMTSDEQQQIVQSAEFASREVVRGVFDAVVSEDKDAPVRAILESITDKGDIKITLKVKTMGEDDAANAILSLHKWRGKMVMLSAASVDDYMGEREPVTIDADQGGLHFESGAD